MAVFLSVLSTFLVGLILAIAPWTSVWDANYLLNAYPILRARGVRTDFRGDVLRLGPAPYLHDDQLHEAAHALDEVIHAAR